MFLAVVAIIAFLIIMTNQTGEFTLVDGGTVPSDICKNVPEVTVIHKEGCPACAIALPILQELEKELNITFNYYDLAVSEDVIKVGDMKLPVQYIPTVIINCKVFIGIKDKDAYKQALLTLQK